MKRIKNNMGNKFDEGQIVLILVLITVVGLTIGLSLISRTITDIRITSQTEQSSRAFSAAEAGIETALSGNIAVGPTGSVNLPGASANYSVSEVGGNNQKINLPLTEVGSGQTVWLIDHNADGSINESGYSYPTINTLEVCFNSLSNSNPAVLASIFYQEDNNFKISKKAFDSIARGNNLLMSDTIGGYCNGSYRNRFIISPSNDADSATTDFNINPTAKLYFLRLQPLYDSTAFTILPQANLPIQGKIISSIGQTESNVVRKIQVFQGYPILPALLDFTFFTEN